MKITSAITGTGSTLITTLFSLRNSSGTSYYIYMYTLTWPSLRLNLNCEKYASLWTLKISCTETTRVCCGCGACSLLDITYFQEEHGASIFRVQVINSALEDGATEFLRTLVSTRLHGIISEKTVSQYVTSRFVTLGQSYGNVLEFCVLLWLRETCGVIGLAWLHYRVMVAWREPALHEKEYKIHVVGNEKAETAIGANGS